MKNFMKYTNEKDLTKDIESLVKTKKYTYIEAILHLCENYDIDPSSISDYISKPISEMIYMEAVSENIGGIKNFKIKSRKTKKKKK